MADYKNLSKANTQYSLPVIITNPPPRNVRTAIPSITAQEIHRSQQLNEDDGWGPRQNHNLPAIVSTKGSGGESSSSAFYRTDLLTTRPTDRDPVETSHIVRPGSSSHKFRATETRPGGEGGDEVDEYGVPSSWRRQELTYPEPEETEKVEGGSPTRAKELQKSKVEWENDIARHILSLYASSTVTKNLRESKQLLDFVGEREIENRKPTFDGKGTEEWEGNSQTDNQTNSQSGNGKSTDGAKGKVNKATTKSDPQQSLLNSKSIHRIEEEIEGVYGENDWESAGPSVTNSAQGVPTTEAGNTDNPPTKKTVKKKVKKIKKKKQTPSPDDDWDSTVTPPPPPPLTAEEIAAKEKENAFKRDLISTLLTRIEKTQRIVRIKDKFRVTNTIRAANGTKIVVRGTPRCFPIWFTASGEVYANWTSLPGGRKLQSHLSVLYESEYYVEYVDIVQAIIVQLWRAKVFGKEEFSVGSFGHSGKEKQSNRNTPNPTRATTAGSTGRTSRSGGRSLNVSTDEREYWYDNVLDEKVDSTLRGELQNRYDSLPNEEKDQINEKKLKKTLSFSFDGLQQEENERERGLTRVDTANSTSRPGTTNSRMHHTQASAQAELITEGFQLTPVLNEEELQILWMQLIMTTVAIGLLSVERKNYEMAMNFFNKAEEFTKNDDLLYDKHKRRMCRAYIKDGMAFYFFRREMAVAAVSYCKQAMEIFDQYDNVDGVAQCLLHLSATNSQIGEFKEAHRILFQFMAMVESGRLATANATPKQLCLVAVAYHNLAVIELKLNLPDMACKSSLNARKIARLCLSYSNRYIDIFQYTHDVALSDMKYDLEHLECDDMTPAQVIAIKELAEALYTLDSGC